MYAVNPSKMFDVFDTRDVVVGNGKTQTKMIHDYMKGKSMVTDT